MRTNSLPMKARAGTPPLTVAAGAGAERRSDLTAERAALVIGVLILVWAGVAIGIDQARYVHLAGWARAGTEGGASVARLFAALVLFLFPTGPAKDRLRWVASAFVVLAVGAFAFGYLPPEVGVTLSLNTTIYLWLAVRIVAGALLITGLTLTVSPRFTWRWFALALALFAGACAFIIANPGALPAPTTEHLQAQAVHSVVTLDRLTVWQWVSEVVAVGVVLAALYGAARQVHVGLIGGWLLIAMVFHAGSQIHGALWPSPYSPVLTSADILRDLFALVVAVGAALELRRIAEERTALLAVERQYSLGVTELSILRANFARLVAHELGTPIASIRALSGRVAGGEAGPAREGELLSAIQAEADVLAALVADVQMGLAVGAETLSVQPRPVRLADLLREAESFARLLPGDHPVSCSSLEDLWVQVDPDRIKQVLRNLLGNAAKYSPSGTPIELRVGVVTYPSLEAERVRIEVLDRGPGISPEDRALIFEKFTRGRAAAAGDTPGTGLGLYICRRIVQAHGGDITVETRPDGGAAFSFELAVCAEPADVALPATASLCVLVVEDHTALRMSLADAFGRQRTVARVLEAGTLARARRFLPECDVALVDLTLPDGQGVELIRELRLVNPRAAALVLTAASDPRELARAVEAGALGLLHKSATPEEIVAAVHRAAAGEPLLAQGDAVEILELAQQRQGTPDWDEPLDQLTPREREVLQALAEGLSDKEIAAKLNIRTATARTHVFRILTKLGAKSRLQAVLIAARRGDVEMP